MNSSQTHMTANRQANPIETLEFLHPEDRERAALIEQHLPDEKRAEFHAQLVGVNEEMRDQLQKQEGAADGMEQANHEFEAFLNRTERGGQEAAQQETEMQVVERRLAQSKDNDVEQHLTQAA